MPPARTRFHNLFSSPTLPHNIFSREVSAKDIAYDKDAKRAVTIALSILFGVAVPIFLLAILCCVHKRRIPQNKKHPLHPGDSNDGGCLVVVFSGAEKAVHTRNRPGYCDGHGGDRRGCCDVPCIGCGVGRKDVEGQKKKKGGQYNDSEGNGGGGLTGQGDVHASFPGQPEHQNTPARIIEVTTSERTGRSPQRRASPNHRYNYPRENSHSKDQRHSIRGRGSSLDTKPNDRRTHRKGTKIRRSETKCLELGGFPAAPRPCTPRQRAHSPPANFVGRISHTQHSPSDPDRLQVPSPNHGRGRSRKYSRRSPPPAPGHDGSPEVSYPDRIYDPHRNQSNISVCLPQGQDCEYGGGGGARVQIHHSSSIDSDHDFTPPKYAPPGASISSSPSPSHPSGSAPSSFAHMKGKGRLEGVSGGSGVSIAGDYTDPGSEDPQAASDKTSYYSWRSMGSEIGMEHPGSLVDFSRGRRRSSPSRSGVTTQGGSWVVKGAIASSTSETRPRNSSPLLVPGTVRTDQSTVETWDSDTNASNVCTRASSSYTAPSEFNGSSSAFDSPGFPWCKTDPKGPTSMPGASYPHKTWSIVTPSSASKDPTGPSFGSTPSVNTVVYAPPLVTDSHSSTLVHPWSYASGTHSPTSSLNVQTGSSIASISVPRRSSFSSTGYLSAPSPAGHQSLAESSSAGHVYLPEPSQPRRSGVFFTPPLLPQLDYLEISVSPSSSATPGIEEAVCTYPTQFPEESIYEPPALLSTCHLASDSARKSINTKDATHRTSLIPSEPVSTVNSRRYAAPPSIYHGTQFKSVSHSNNMGYTVPLISTFIPSESLAGGSRQVLRPHAHRARENLGQYVSMPQITITQESRILAVPQRVAAADRRSDIGVTGSRGVGVGVGAAKVIDSTKSEVLGALRGEGVPVSIMPSVMSRYKATVESVIDDSDDTGGVGVA